MENRFVISIIIGTLVAFFGGWAIFGMAMGDFYVNHMRAEAFAVAKDPPVYWAIAASNFAWVTLIAVYLRFTNNIGFVKGFVNSLWISLLVGCICNFSVYGFWSFYSLKFTLIDLLAITVYWAFIGGIIGAIQKLKAIKPTPAE